MALLSWLCELGGKLKIIQAAPVKNDTAPVKLTTRSVTLKDLISEVQAQQVKALAQLPAELSVPFEKVFEAAGSKPPAHGWTIVKLQELLSTAPYKGMDRAALQQAVLALLTAQQVGVEDLVKDAIFRDQSLDAYEEFARKKMELRTTARQEKIARILSQIEDLRRQSGDLEKESDADRQLWRQWHRQKTDYEKAMAAALGCLLDKPVVTIDLAEE